MRKTFSAFTALVVVFSVASYAADFPAKKIYETYSPAVVVMHKDKTTLYPKIKVYLRPDRVTGSIERDLSKGYGAEVVSYSVELDLALLKMSGGLPRLNVIEFANPEEILVGEEVVAIGHPEPGAFWPLTYGRISGEIGDFQGVEGKEVFQTDTSV